MDYLLELKGIHYSYEFIGRFGEELRSFKPTSITKSEADAEIYNLFHETLCDLDEITESDWAYFKEELKRRYMRVSDYVTGKFGIYVTMHIDTGSKVSEAPTIEHWGEITAVYYPDFDEDNDEGLLASISDELALRYAAIRHDRMYFCQFFRR